MNKMNVKLHVQSALVKDLKRNPYHKIILNMILTKAFNFFKPLKNCEFCGKKLSKNKMYWCNSSCANKAFNEAIAKLETAPFKKEGK